MNAKFVGGTNTVARVTRANNTQHKKAVKMKTKCQYMFEGAVTKMEMKFVERLPEIPHYIQTN